LGRLFKHTHRRSHRLRCIGLCALALLASTWPAIADGPRQPAANYLRHTFTTEDGLPSNVVNDVLQTRDGFLIVGAAPGLFRFDGHRFAEMSSDPPQDIIVHSLAEGPDGDIWAATRFGVYRFPHAEIDQRTQTLSVYHVGEGAADSVRCLRFTRAGALWAGSPDGLFYFAIDHFQKMAAVQNVQRIEEARNGHLLISTTHGFFEWDGSRVVEHPEIPVALGIRAEDLFHVLQDRSGVTWYCTGMGIFRQSGASLKRFLPDPTGGKNGASRAYEDPAGYIWFQTAAGLFRASSDSLESIAPDISARTIIPDRDGNLWVGTNGAGLIRFKNRTVRTFTKADGLPNDVVMTVLATADGKLWAGNNCGGLSWLDGGRFHTYDEKDGLTNSCVNALAEDSKHDLWVGTAGGGLFRFHAGHFQVFTQTDGLGSNTVTCILSARDGSLWIATTEGLARLHDGVLRNYTTADGLSHRVIANVLQDSSGVVWVATNGGIDRLDGDKFVAAFRPQDRREMYLAGESPLGDLYVAVEGLGMSRLKDGKLMGVAPLYGTQIQVVQQDLWIAGGTGGVVRVGAASLRSWEDKQQDPIDHTEFGRADGLLLEECANGYPNITTTKDGKLWVATLGGVAMLDLSGLPPAAGKPFEYISEIDVDRKKRSAGRELILPPGLHHTELQLGSIELSSPERAHMQYRLEGIDSAWLDVRPDGAAVYTTIPHGSYLFHVRASNDDGVWDRQGIVYRITQEPFFYQTAWFQASGVAAFLGMLCGLYWYRMRRLAHEFNIRLEERVTERTRIARDLHDTLLQSFHGLMLHFQVVNELLPHGRAKAELEKSLGHADRAIAEGRSALYDLRSSAIATSDLPESIKALGDELSAEGAATFRLVVEGPPRKVQTMIRDELYRIAREALRNAFHHAQARHIEAEITYGGRAFLLHIRDDGEGIPPGILEQGRPGHYGVRGMRERAKQIGGKLDIWSGVGAGTEIEFSIAASIAYGMSPGRTLFHVFRKKQGEL
jgi:ligand-binding sensor domain-containing protein